MYYLLVVFAVILFGVCFSLNDAYRKERGSDFVSGLENACIGALAGFVLLLFVGKFQFQATLFTLLVAFLTAVCIVGFILFSFKALDSVNLSVYSLFSMLGGMALPFFQGILFYGEPLTFAKGICVICILVSLSMTVSHGEKKKGSLYYLGVFVLNGMTGVLSKWFTSASLAKTNAEWLSVWTAFFTALISGIAWLYLLWKKNPVRLTKKAVLISSVNGSLNRIASLLMLFALVHVDASVQYPLVTGGVMIVSTVICFFGREKPTGKEVLSVFIAFLGLLALFLLPV